MYLYLLCVLSDKIMKKNISNSTIYIFKLLFIQITDRCPMQCRLLIINSDYLNVCCCPRISLAMYSDYPNVCRLDVLDFPWKNYFWIMRARAPYGRIIKFTWAVITIGEYFRWFFKCKDLVTMFLEDRVGNWNFGI